jgi:hypothetical protein
MTPLPTPHLDELFARLRARLVGHVQRHALGRLLLTASAGLGVLFLADVSLELPGAVRLLLLALLFGGVAFVVWHHYKRPMAEIPERVGLAVLLERAHPELNELFTSAAQLSRTKAQGEHERSLIQSLITRAEASAPTFEFSAVEDPTGPRRALFGGLASLLILSLLLGSNTERSAIFFARMAGAGPAWPRATTLRVEIPLASGTVEVSPDGEHLAVSCARGSDIPVVIRAEGELPDQVILQHSGGARTILPRTGAGVFRTLLRSVQDDMSFGVVGGDDTDGTPTVAITVLQPPDVIGLAVRITPPPYTGAAETIIQDTDVEVLAGSTLVISVLTAPADAAGIVRILPADRELTLDPGTWPITAQPVPTAEEPDLSADATASPCRQFRIQPTESLTYRFELTDERGLPNPDPGLFAVRVLPDRAPVIELLSPARGEVETVAGGAISLRGRVADDHGIASVTTRIWAAPDAEPLALTTDVAALVPWTPQQRDAQSAFCLIEFRDAQAEGTSAGPLAVIAGQTLQLEFMAIDRRDPPSPDAEAHSSPLRVRIVSPDEFLRRLQDRLARVRSEISSLLDVQSEKHSQTALLVRSLEGDEPGATNEGDARALANGLRRIHGDARSIARDLAEIADGVIHARLDERQAGLFHALVSAGRARTDRSFDPELWRTLAARDDANAGLTGKLVGVTALTIEISDDLVEPAREATLRASQTRDLQDAHAALSQSLALQSEARAKTELLLAELAEWDNFQSVLSLTRDILNRQKSLTERARQYAKDH